MPRILNQEDLGHSIEISPGEAVVVRLDENPTTGYRWYLDDFPEGKLRIVSDHFRIESDAFGAGGVRELIFEPLQPGHHVVVLRNSFLGRGLTSDSKARLELDVK